MKLHAVLDACVLIPMPLADTLLHLAKANLYCPVWSPELLEETRRNLIRKLGVPEDKADQRVATMRQAFPLAEVNPPTPLVDAMTVDAKDRHVAAAAVTAGAVLIVTYNLRDFPPEALKPYGITAIHPDEFLLDLLDQDPVAVAAAVAQQRTRLRSPAVSAETFHQVLAVHVPHFAQQLAALQIATGADNRASSATSAAEMPLPIETRTPDEMREVFFPNGEPDDAVTPFGVMACWFLAMQYSDDPENLEVLQKLSYNPEHWGDYSYAAAMIEGFAQAQYRHPDTTNPANICYFKLIKTDAGGRMFAHAEIHDPVLWVMLARDSIFDPWRVLAVGPRPWDILDDAGGPSASSEGPPRQPH